MKFNYCRSLVCLFVVMFLASAGFAFAETESERDARLRAELSDIERDIQNQQAILSTKQLEGASISRDIAILDAKIQEAKLKIKKHNIAIEQLGKDIVVRSNNIKKLDTKIDLGKESLGQILRKTNQIDDYSVPEAFLSGEELSDFFSDLDSFDSVKLALSETFTEFRDAKKENEQEKEVLGKKRNVEIDTRVNVEVEKAIIEKSETEKKRLLALNKAEQAGYQKVIADKAKRAAEIRAALFKLRDSAAIPFGTAVDYAKEASRATGVRPAFLLSIITQESNLGANVGRCLLTNTETGEGVRSSTGAAVKNVMKPSRDIAPFLEITKQAGRDPFTTVVSCPLDIGYGGAMGPAQFIPSTWQINADRIAKAIGASFADPWNPEHAFMASAIYLSDLGAVSGSYTAERNAACKYYSGKSCGLVKGNTTYGNQVVERAKSIQANIDILEGN